MPIIQPEKANVKAEKTKKGKKEPSKAVAPESAAIKLEITQQAKLKKKRMQP